ncbi:MAG: GxxExxY protein [Anaerolineae bacterium]|nr:GxxExxY protein [Anaerolineae bacterium]
MMTASYEPIPKEVERWGKALLDAAFIAEIKAVDAVHPLHQAQLISYLQAASLRLGFLLNFNVRRLKDGIRRIVV